MKRRIGYFLLFVMVGVFFCIAMTGCCFKHEFAEATCTEPKTCVKCGKTEGEALGHEWIGATCTKPKTCSVCGATEGAALGHKIETEAGYEATCTKDGLTEGKHCTVCGEVLATQTTIPAYGHNWEDATLYKPKTCKTCGATEGVKKAAKYMTNFKDYIDEFNRLYGPEITIKKAGDAHRLFLNGKDANVWIIGYDTFNDKSTIDSSAGANLKVDKIEISLKTGTSGFDAEIFSALLILADPVVKVVNSYYSTDIFTQNMKNVDTSSGSSALQSVTEGWHIFKWTDNARGYDYDFGARKWNSGYEYAFYFQIRQN